MLHVARKTGASDDGCAKKAPPVRDVLIGALSGRDLAARTAGVVDFLKEKIIYNKRLKCQGLFGGPDIFMCPANLRRESACRYDGMRYTRIAGAGVSASHERVKKQET